MKREERRRGGSAARRAPPPLHALVPRAATVNTRSVAALITTNSPRQPLGAAAVI
jgi:hypothetical protein